MNNIGKKDKNKREVKKRRKLKNLDENSPDRVHDDSNRLSMSSMRKGVPQSTSRLINKSSNRKKKRSKSKSKSKFKRRVKMSKKKKKENTTKKHVFVDHLPSDEIEEAKVVEHSVSLSYS